ncbi:MAG: EpsG family protein [Bacteroidales bacterium]|nr:EpsG family protein [Bacteroidales bacterium]
MNYLALLFEDISIFYYTLIFLLASKFAFNAQYKTVNGNIVFRPHWFLICFLFLWVFFAFNDVGSDLPQYRLLFDESKDGTSTYGTGLVEIGYIYLNYIIHLFTDNAIYGVAIIRTIQLAIVFFSFYLLRDNISIGYAVTAYVALFYFASFNILRSSLAGAICILNISLLLKDKSIFCIPLMLLSFFIHRSSALFVIPILSYFILYQSPLKKMGKVVKIAYVAASVFALVYGASLLQHFVDQGFGAGRFDDYLEEEQTVGIMFIFVYAPLFWALYKSYKIKSFRNSRLYKLTFVFLIFECFVALLSYKVGILTRADIYFSMPILMFIPAFLRQGGNSTNPNIRGSNQWRFVIFLYLVIRFAITTSGIFKVSMIDNFHFINL